MTHDIKVKKNGNDQYIVSCGNLTLIHSVFCGSKVNDASVYIPETDSYECVSSWSEEFKPLFVALHNFKNEEQ